MDGKTTKNFKRYEINTHGFLVSLQLASLKYAIYSD